MPIIRRQVRQGRIRLSGSGSTSIVGATLVRSAQGAANGRVRLEGEGVSRRIGLPITPYWNTVPEIVFTKNGVAQTYDLNLLAFNEPAGSYFDLETALPGVTINTSTGVLTYDGTSNAAQVTTRAMLVEPSGLEWLPEIQPDAPGRGLPTGSVIDFGKHSRWTYRPSANEIYINPADINRFTIPTDRYSSWGAPEAFSAILKIDCNTDQWSVVHDKFGVAGEDVPHRPDGVTWCWDENNDDGLYMLAGSNAPKTQPWPSDDPAITDVGTWWHRQVIFKWNLATGRYEKKKDYPSGWSNECMGGIYDPVQGKIIMQIGGDARYGSCAFIKYDPVSNEVTSERINYAPPYGSSNTCNTARWTQCFDPVRRKMYGFDGTFMRLVSFDLDNPSAPGAVQILAQLPPMMPNNEVPFPGPGGTPVPNPIAAGRDAVEALLVYMPAKNLLVLFDQYKVYEPNLGLGGDGLPIAVYNVLTGELRRYNYPPHLFHYSDWLEPYTGNANAGTHEGCYSITNDIVYASMMDSQGTGNVGVFRRVHKVRVS